MTLFNQTQSQPHAMTLRIANFLETTAERIRAGYIWRRSYNQTHRELSGLQDRELLDLGISRWDIERISAEAAQGAVNQALGNRHL